MAISVLGFAFEGLFLWNCNAHYRLVVGPYCTCAPADIVPLINEPLPVNILNDVT